MQCNKCRARSCDSCGMCPQGHHVFDERNSWIRVKDKLPEKGKELLYLNGKKELTIGRCFDIEDQNRVWIMDDIRGTNEIATHWMTLPALPSDWEEIQDIADYDKGSSDLILEGL